ncbi:ribonuclease H-like domain-containing protein [Tanacetum coccineum]
MLLLAQQPPTSPPSIPSPIEPQPARTHSMVTRSQSGIVKPIKSLSLHTSSPSPIPKSPFIALKDPNWCNAMYDEYNALADGTLSHYKAHLVANGSNQQHDVDFNETFSPNAFLNGDLSEIVYMHRLPGFVDPHYPNHACLLQRSLYGLKQAPLQQICLYMHDPREPHFAALKRIMRYVQGTLELGLHLYASATTSLVRYTDADWAGFPSTRRSTFGYCVFLGDNLLSWSAKRQHTISCFSAEAEYRGVANIVAETAWIRNLLRELHSPLLTATLVYCDNVSAVYMSANPVQHHRTKHIEIDIHFVRDMVKAGHVRVLHVPSRFQYADIFTKGLPLALFEDF